MAEAVHAVAYLGYVPEQSLLAAVLSFLERHADGLGVQETTNVLWSLAAFDALQPPLWNRLMQRLIDTQDIAGAVTCMRSIPPSLLQCLTPRLHPVQLWHAGQTLDVSTDCAA